MFKKFFSKHNVYLTGLLFTLLFFGLITLFSTTSGTGYESENYFFKQFVFVILGTVLYILSSFLNLKVLKYLRAHFFLYLVLIFLLIAVLLFTERVKGASRWFVVTLPLMGSINIQPSDIAKLVVLISGGFIFTQWHKITANVKNTLLRNQYLAGFLFLIPLIILTLIQPALGTTIIITLTMLAMCYFSVKKKSVALWFILEIILTIVVWVIFNQLAFYFKMLISLVTCAFIYFTFFKTSSKILSVLVFIFFSIFIFLVAQPNSINYLGEYQKDRIVCWQNPELDPLGKCFQQTQAKIAIGSGELFGRGFSQGLQVQRDRLPEFQNDFIYAAYAEQYGFIGTIVLLLVYFLFVVEIFRISVKQESEYSRVVIMGVGVMFILQVFINIAMNMGVLPTTGISLPFMSYGGSFILVSMISVGIVQNLSHNNILPDKDNKYEKWDDV